MVNLLITVVLVIMIAVSAMVMSVIIGLPVIKSGITVSEIRDAESDLQGLDNIITEVAEEGEGAAREFTFSSPEQFRAEADADAIMFSSDIDTEIYDYLSRSTSGNLIFINGNDVDCFENDDNDDGITDLVMENSLIKFVFNYTERITPHSPIDTTTSIISITDKTSETTVNPVNSSIFIDGSSASGTGFSELIEAGKSRPTCAVKFFINSTNSYDAIYRLYSGADFAVVEVRNIK